MKVLIGSTSTLIKVGFLVAVVVVATLGFLREPDAESASNTEIMFSYSSTAAIPAPSIILNPGGDPRHVYIWATNVKNATGVSGFNLAVQYNDSVVTVTDDSPTDIDGIGDKTWLQSTSRSGACIPDQSPQPGLIIGLCSTLTPPPPLGPTGDGMLGHIVLTPGTQQATPSGLVLVAPEVCPPSCVGVQGTFLLDTTVDPDDTARIPATLLSSSVVYLGCGDNSPPPNGDGIVDLPNDILGVILRFQMTPAHPDWDPLFDINDDGVIDLPNDILGTIMQFQLPCSHT